MIPATRQGRLTVLLAAGAAVLLVLILSSRGGPLMTAYPTIATLTPFAVLAVGLLILSAVWPTASLAIALFAPFYSPDTRTLGASLACLSVAMVSTMWRQRRLPWFGPAYIAALGVIVVLLSYAAPLEPPPSARAAVVYSIYVGIAAAVIAARPAALLVIFGLLSLYATYRALATPALRTDRGDVVLLGLNANGIGFLCALAVVCGAVLVSRQGRATKIVGIALAAAGLSAVVQSGSRGALLAAIGGVMTVALSKRLSTMNVKGLASLVAAAAAFYWLSEPAMTWLARASGRDTTAIAQNVTSRASATRYALHATAQHPITGVGLSDLDRYSLLDVNASYHLSAHNVLVERFAESGVVVGLAFAGLILLALARARRHNARLLLPLVVFLIVSGISLDWFVDGRLGEIGMAVLGTSLAAGLPRQQQTSSTTNRLVGVEQQQ